jgi:putative inorganic carbon (hco3(-)) transporter
VITRVEPTLVSGGWVEPAVVRSASPGPGKGSAGGAAFALFVLVTGVLFLRPGDVLPSVRGWPIYEACILACMVAAFPTLAQNGSRGVTAEPGTMCVFGVVGAIALSQLALGAIGDAVSESAEFAKILVYYLLLVTVVDSPERLRRFLWWVGMFIAGHAALATMQYHGVIDLPAMAAMPEPYFDREAGQWVTTIRLCGGGIFGNPNDVSRMLVVGIAIAAYWLRDPRAVFQRPVWLGVLALCGYALTQTKSRGGMIDLMVTVLVLFRTSLGGRKGTLVGLVSLPVLLALTAGRQTDISTSTDTAQLRIQFWSQGFAAMRSSPLFGIGSNHFNDVTSGHQEAHNSFVHAYVDLGLIGGTLFAGAFYFCFWVPGQLDRARVGRLPEELARARPYLVAILAGYAAGLLSSSRVYTPTTYVLLGLMAVWVRLALAGGAYSPPPRFDGRLVARLAAVGVVVLVVLYTYTRLAVNW